RRELGRTPAPLARVLDALDMDRGREPHAHLEPPRTSGAIDRVGPGDRAGDHGDAFVEREPRGALEEGQELTGRARALGIHAEQTATTQDLERRVRGLEIEPVA